MVSEHRLIMLRTASTLLRLALSGATVKRVCNAAERCENTAVACMKLEGIDTKAALAAAAKEKRRGRPLNELAAELVGSYTDAVTYVAVTMSIKDACLRRPAG